MFTGGEKVLVECVQSLKEERDGGTDAKRREVLLW